MSSQPNAQITETRELPEMGVRYRSQSCRHLHRQDPGADDPEPACDVTERDGDDCEFLRVNITRLLPFRRWSLCRNPKCFGEDPDGIDRGEGIETDGGEPLGHYESGDRPFPSAFPGIGIGAVLYEDRPDTPDDERRLHHVVDIRISTETTDVYFVVEDGTHTQRFHYQEEDLLADFAPAGWRWPTGMKPTYWLTRRCGVDDKMDLMTDGGIGRSKNDTDQKGVGLGNTIDRFLREDQPGYVVDSHGPTLHLIDSTNGQNMTALCGDNRSIHGGRVMQIFGHPDDVDYFEEFCPVCKAKRRIRSPVETDRFHGGQQ